MLSRLIIAACAVLSSLASAGAAVPSLVNYQGILTDSGGTPQIGTFSVTFKIYDVPAGGAALWTETQGTVTTNSDGLFNILLGSVTPLTDIVFSGADRYLATTVSPDAEMTPRTRIATVGYAFRPSTVDGASGGNITSKVSIGPGHVNSGIDAFVAGSSNAAAGNYAAIPGGINNGANGNYTFAAGRRAHANHAGTFVWADSTDADFLSTGSNQFLIRASGGVGIGTSDPEGPLHVFRGNAGTVTANIFSSAVFEAPSGCYVSLLSPDASERGLLFGEPSNNAAATILYNNSDARDGFRFGVNGNTNEVVIDSLGRVGIGTHPPEGPLHVSRGSAGTVTANIFSSAVFEAPGGCYVSLLSPDASERGLLFGEPSNNADGVILYNDNLTPDGFQFTVNGNQRKMVLDSAGRLGIGTASPDQRLHVQDGSAGAVTANGNSSGVFERSDENWIHILSPDATMRGILLGSPSNALMGSIRFNTATRGKGYEIRGRNNNILATIDSLGNLNASGNITATGTCCVSDERLKRNIRSLSGGLDKVMCLRAVSYEWKPDESGERIYPTSEQIGLIAQEVQKVVPQAVAEDKDGYLSVDYARLVPLLIEGMKEQQKRIEALEKKLDQQTP